MADKWQFEYHKNDIAEQPGAVVMFVTSHWTKCSDAVFKWFLLLNRNPFGFSEAFIRWVALQ